MFIQFHIKWHLSLFSVDGEAQKLTQPQMSITRGERKTARIECHVVGFSENDYIHWYRQKPDAALERILYFSTGNPVFDQVSDRGKFEVRKESSGSICILTVPRTTKSDTATYYCAAWDDTVLESH
uniref:Ig-like domain-containing protein n=1 Tax=Pelusios castaneus TaxID=367368 RepID=A0A8C8SSU3_9SAUR